MKLTVLGSSSSGNCYIIHNESECLIIEAGINIKHVNTAIDFDISIIDGVLCSHKHSDHSGFIESYSKIGVKVYAGSDVLKSMDQTRSYTHIELKHKEKVNVGRFRVLPLNLTHDVPCLGFLINHPEMGSMLFATDTTHIPYRFSGVNHYLVECNYDTDTINSNDTNANLADRVVNSHLSFDNFIKFMNAQDLSRTNNIVLLHLSDNNSDYVKFLREVKAMYDCNVYIARKGLKLEINKQAF